MSDTNQPKLHVAFASAEAAPFVKTGGLGDVAGSLPQALKAAGAEVVVLVPKYDTIAQEYKDRMEHLCEFYVPLGWRNEYCGIERLNWGGVDYLFIDNERYFKRGYPYGFFDDGERFAFFSKAIVESLQHLPHVIPGFTCDVLHCNDWHTAMAPVFLREFYQGSEFYRNIKTVFSIHNIAFQGQFTAKILNDILGLAHIPAAAFQLTCGPDAINYMQGALNYTDSITTVSPTYAEEIKTAEFGEHLDGILRRRAPILQGIVNGIDTTGFDPATDSRIAANYTAADRSGKAICKARLQEELGLEVRDDRPLMVMVTRLTRQKGMDLVTYALDRILSGGVQVAVLGTGDDDFENALRYFQNKYPGTMAARIQFDPALSQRMYAGADLFLMPSLFEPCGLSQMIAMRYGTLPIVRETGGLKDTVAPYNQYTGEGTGFSFAHFNGDEMADAVFRAARLFWDDRAAFDKLVDNAMNADFSWTRSAETYLNVYHNLHPEIPLPEPPAPEVEPQKEPDHVEEHAADEPVAKAEPKAAPKAEPKPADEPAVEAEVKPEPASAPKEEAPKKKPAAKRATTAKKPAAKVAPATEEAAAEPTPVKKPAAKRATAAKKAATTANAPATETKAQAATKKPAAKRTTASKTAATKTAPATTRTPAAKATTAKSASTTAETTATKATSTTAKTATTKATAAQPAAEPAPASAVPKKAPAKRVTATKSTAKLVNSTAKKPVATTTATVAPTTEPAAKPAAPAKPAAVKKAATAKVATAAKPATAKVPAATASTAKPAAPKATTAKAPAAAKPAARPKPSTAKSAVAAKPAAPAKSTTTSAAKQASKPAATPVQPALDLAAATAAAKADPDYTPAHAKPKASATKTVPKISRNGRRK